MIADAAMPGTATMRISNSSTIIDDVLQECKMSTLCLPTRNVAVKPCKGPNLSIRTFSRGGRRGLDLAGAAAFDRGCQRFSATVVAAQRGRR